MFQPADLARYRVMFAAYGLLTLPSFAWVSAFPDSVFRPPPGPAALFSGLPDAWVLYLLEALLAIALVALLLGVRIWMASITATLAMSVGFGLTDSLGKIDHNALFVLAPVVMAFAGWAGNKPVREWVMRLWAFAIGLAMLSAGLMKVSAGWLDPGTHATRGSVAVFTHVFDRGGPFAELALRNASALFWEPMDFAAVALECGLILTVFSWKWFRRALAVLCLFHLGVLCLFDIPFGLNVVVYAAFFPWSALRLPDLAPLKAVWVVPTGVAIWGLHLVVHPEFVVAAATVVLGAALGAGHLWRSVVGRASDRENLPAPTDPHDQVSGGPQLLSSPPEGRRRNGRRVR